MRHVLDGCNAADSLVLNPHKWLFTNFDCNCFFVSDREALTRTLTIMPEYLRNKASDSGTVTDYRDWQIPLGRRFRSLKLWFVLRYYGLEGLRHHIRRHIELAGQFAEWVEGSDGYELCAAVSLNLVCFRHKGGNSINRAILEQINQSGTLYLSHTELNGTFMLRLCVGQTHTEERHIRNAWETIQKIADRLEKKAPKSGL